MREIIEMLDTNLVYHNRRSSFMGISKNLKRIVTIHPAVVRQIAKVHIPISTKKLNTHSCLQSQFLME